MRKQKKDRISLLSNNSNSSKGLIIPGTFLMEEIKRKIRVWIKEETSKRPNMNFYLSGTDEPGEGELKIMNYISSLKETNDVSFIFSPDSDMILLMLSCFHQRNLYLCNTLKNNKFSCYSKPNLMKMFESIDSKNPSEL